MWQSWRLIHKLKLNQTDLVTLSLVVANLVETEPTETNLQAHLVTLSLDVVNLVTLSLGVINLAQIEPADRN